MSEENKAKFSFKPLVITGVMTIVLGLLFWLVYNMFVWGGERAEMGVWASHKSEMEIRLYSLMCGIEIKHGFGNSLMYSLQWFFGGLIYIVTTIVFLAAAFFGATYRPSTPFGNKFVGAIPQILVFLCAIAVAVGGVWAGVKIFDVAKTLWWESFWVTFNGVFQFLISVFMIILQVLTVALSGFFLVKRLSK